MKNNKRETIFLRLSFYFSFIFLVYALFALIRFLPTLNFKIKTVNHQPQSVKIVRVIDGDTVVTESNQKVRLIGINTPEVTANNPKKCLGDIASIKTKELLEGKYVILEKDVSDTDKYDRLLRYIWLNNQLINKTLVQEGYAQVDTIKPDIKYQQTFIDAQNQAKTQKLGLWSKSNCTNQSLQN